MRKLEKSMYYGASQVTFEKARRLRSRETEAELKLWNLLKGKQIQGLRFRRQHPIETFIVDFYCRQAKLLIEVDGRIHLNQKESDETRSAEIEKYGLWIIRFTNEEILSDPENVLQVVEKILMDRISEKL